MQSIILYFPVIAILTNIIVATSLAVLSRFQPRFSYHWILAASGALFSWVLILASRLSIPGSIPLGVWETGVIQNAPILLLDGFSWLFAISLATLGLALVLSDSVRIKTANWKSWTGSLIMISLGIVAVMAGNQLTILLAWAGIDLIEMMMWMVNVNERGTRQRIVITFSIRALAIMLTFWPSNSLNYFILAVVIRLAVLPIHLPEMAQANIRRGLGTVLRLVSPIASLVFMVRIAVIGIPEDGSQPWLVLVLLIAIFSSISWLRSKNELEGRPYWVMGMSMMSLASAIRNQPSASIVWALSLVLAGGFIFLYSSRARWLNLLLMITVIGISGLPFSPSWDAGRLYAAPLFSWQLLFLLPQAFLLLGYLRFAIQPGEAFDISDRMTWIVYPWGLFLLPLTQFATGYWRWTEILQSGTDYQYPGTRNVLEFWSGLGAFILVMIMIATLRVLPSAWIEKIKDVKLGITLNWVGSLYALVFSATGNFVSMVSELVEGEGGFLWTLLLLALLVIFFAQGGLGI